MVKFIAAAIWILIASVGSVLYAFQSAQGRSVEVPEIGLTSGLDFLRTDIISVPVMTEGHIHGYFLARLVYTVEPAKLAKLTVPAQALLVDEVYSYLYGNPLIDFTDRKNLDLDAFRGGIRESINRRVGDEKFIHDVIIEQVDYLAKQETRNQPVQQRLEPSTGG